LIVLAPEAPLATKKAEARLAAKVTEHALGPGRGVHPAVRMLRPASVFLLVAGGALFRAHVVLRLDIAVLVRGRTCRLRRECSPDHREFLKIERPGFREPRLLIRRSASITRHEIAD